MWTAARQGVGARAAARAALRRRVRPRAARLRRVRAARVRVVWCWVRPCRVAAVVVRVGLVAV